LKIISHRGNTSGPVPKNENLPSYIDKALEEGFDVEIDLRKIKDEFYLGHDKTDYKVSLEWLENRKENLWIHTKNFNAFESLLEINRNFIFFYYTSEPLVLVSNGKIWTHSPKKIANPKNCIIPLLGKTDLGKSNVKNWFGVCTDFPILLKNNFKC
tara:strand:+ start:16679 stop:17146 length:468 start_codon:yes stop_codon:yes gene_type:complete